MSKWIIAIKNILKGNYYRLFNKEEDLYNQRYLICQDCKDKIDSPIGEICGHCGCPLKAKLRVKEETCFMNKF